jgi:hypothetical protein
VSRIHWFAHSRLAMGLALLTCFVSTAFAQKYSVSSVSGQHGIRSGPGAESAMESVRLPDRGRQNIPPDEDVAERANQSGNAVPGDCVTPHGGVMRTYPAFNGKIAGRITVAARMKMNRAWLL